MKSSDKPDENLKPEDIFDFNCSPILPSFIDPMSLLLGKEVDGFKYEGAWPRYDELTTFYSGDSEEIEAKALINQTSLPFKSKSIQTHVEGLSGLMYGQKNPFPLLSNKCIYCQNSIFHSQIEEFEEEDFLKIKALEYCDNCAYWRWHNLHIETDVDYLASSYESFMSKIKEFDNRLPDGVISDFASWVRRDQRRWNTMKPYALELLVADIFKHNFHPCEVFHVGKTNDGGVDVIFVDSGKRRWLVQVKRRESSKSSEPIDTLRNLLGAMLLRDSSYGIIVSTADHFTSYARKAQKEAGERGFSIQLIDRGKLNELLGASIPDRAWISILQEKHPEIVSHFEQHIPSVKVKQNRMPNF